MYLKSSVFALLATMAAVSMAAPAPNPAAAPQYGDYGDYGNYGDYGAYPPTSPSPTPEPTGYGSYGSYGEYAREVQPQPVARAAAPLPVVEKRNE